MNPYNAIRERLKLKLELLDELENETKSISYEKEVTHGYQAMSAIGPIDFSSLKPEEVSSKYKENYHARKRGFTAKHWSLDQDEELKELFKLEGDLETYCDEKKRTPAAVEMRLRSLQVIRGRPDLPKTWRVIVNAYGVKLEREKKERLKQNDQES